MSFDHESGDNTYPESRDNFEGPEVQTPSMMSLGGLMGLVAVYAYRCSLIAQPCTAQTEKAREAKQDVERAIMMLISERDQANAIAVDCKAQNERLVEELRMARQKEMGR